MTGKLARFARCNLRSHCWARMLAAALSVAWLSAAAPAMAQSKRAYDDARTVMVKQDLEGNGIKNKRVLEAMGKVLRHEFVPLNLRTQAYHDMALAIGEGQTISSPYIVAFMTEQLDPQPTDKVLEIGTGSGYQAAVLGEIVKEVYSIEIVEPLARKATATLRQGKYDNVKVKAGDGFAGWKEHAPFDKIIVTCSPETVPQPLVDQLKEGGRIVVPVGQRYQQVLYLYRKKGGKLEPEALQTTFFVPMTGSAESKRKVKPDPANPSISNGGFEEVIEIAEATAEQAAGAPNNVSPNKTSSNKATPAARPAPNAPAKTDEPHESPLAWYYMQQMAITKEPGCAGQRCAEFANVTAGRQSHVLQGFPVDGRKVRELTVSARVKGDKIRPGEDTEQLPHIVISFFDERRAPVGEPVVVGRWFGSFDWQPESAAVPVPGKAREASIRLGLLGAVGNIWFDEVNVKRAGAK
jgi:protein-L-isoaspartate(D-aspartate) O-methyltransferase